MQQKLLATRWQVFVLGLLLLAGHLLVYGRDQERPWIDSANKKTAATRYDDRRLFGLREGGRDEKALSPPAYIPLVVEPLLLLVPAGTMVVPPCVPLLMTGATWLAGIALFSLALFISARCTKSLAN